MEPRGERKSNGNPMPYVDITTDSFGCILNCAVRYAIGRQTYMPAGYLNE